MEIYLVGGAVRDKLLGLPVKDKDWVVVGATAEQMLTQGYQQVGKDFPVFLHPQTKEEYALARTERKTSRGYTGFETVATPDITLEQDLQRRDLTINAMAESIDGQLIDPFHGQQDLEAGLLRHVSEAFAEDPLRILRVARFAARYAPWGFKVAHSTNRLMRQMVADGEVDALVPERVWAETCKALSEKKPARYFQVLHGCGALGVIFPEIERLYKYDTQTTHDKDHNSALCNLDKAAELSTQAEIRFAALLLPVHYHATGDIEALCERLKTPKRFHELAKTAGTLLARYDEQAPLSATQLLNLFMQLDAFRRPQRFRDALTACRADSEHPLDTADRLAEALTACLEIDTKKFIAQGLQGRQIRTALFNARIARLEQMFNRA